MNTVQRASTKMRISDLQATSHDESTNPSNGWADMESDDLDAVPTRAKKADPQTFREPCAKCAGTGRYRGPSSYGSACFACVGRGFNEFKTSRESRELARAKASDRKAAKKAAGVAEWRAANPIEAEWIDAKASTFGFAQSMHAALLQWGSLTAGQLTAIRRCIVADGEREVAKAAQTKVADVRSEVVEIARIEAAFAKAKASGLKWPAITLPNVCFKPASANSRNPGAIYVSSSRRLGTYLGKIVEGRFSPSRDCDEARQAEIVKVMADPEAAAKEHGLLTGNCCICSRELTNKESIALGIGPICAERFGW